MIVSYSGVVGDQGTCKNEKMVVEEARPPTPSSPTNNNKVKFLCSHGGKILPRPIDNQLKYVGGETRVVSVPHDITFAELSHKITTLFEGNVILKYQLASEDLDTLVSVRSDEDLKYMFEEYHRQETEGSSRLRAFLFPATPIVMDTQTSPIDPNALEERYIDAINGIIRQTTKLGQKTSPNPHTFSLSSGCSSPKSPPALGDPHQMESSMYQETISVHSYQGARGPVPVHKVQSSPSLYNYSTSPGNNQYLYLHHPPIPHLHGYPSPKPAFPTDPHKMVVGTEKLTLAIPTGPAGRNPFNTPVYNQLGYPPNRYHRGSGHLYDDNGN